MVLSNSYPNKYPVLPIMQKPNTFANRSTIIVVTFETLKQNRDDQEKQKTYTDAMCWFSDRVNKLVIWWTLIIRNWHMMIWQVITRRPWRRSTAPTA